jgi:3-dehydrosphinganine reductase
VHCYFPGTILSPGYEAENLTKPKLTKVLEGGPEEGSTPRQCAIGLLKGEEKSKTKITLLSSIHTLLHESSWAGVSSNHFFITTDFQSELFRGSAAGGSVPSNMWLYDRLIAFIALVSAIQRMSLVEPLLNILLLYLLSDRPTGLADIRRRSYRKESSLGTRPRG